MDLLYKYYSVDSDYAIQNFKNNTISFSALTTLNDPFEGYGSHFFAVEEDHDLKETGCFDFEFLNTDSIQRYKDMITFKYRIFCSSKKYDNPVLWAHYANNHQGFCVGYDPKELAKVSYFHQEILYTEEQFPLNRILEEQSNDPVKNEALIQQLILRKSKYWEYEEEIRFLYHVKTGDKRHQGMDLYFNKKEHESKKIYTLNRGELETLVTDTYIDQPVPGSVLYLGLNMAEENKKVLLEIAKENNVPVFQMTQKTNCFTLMPREVS